MPNAGTERRASMASQKAKALAALSTARSPTSVAVRGRNLAGGASLLASAPAKRPPRGSLLPHPVALDQRRHGEPRERSVALGLEAVRAALARDGRASEPSSTTSTWHGRSSL